MVVGSGAVGRWSMVLIKPTGKMQYSPDSLVTKKVVKAVLLEAIPLIKELKNDITVKQRQKYIKTALNCCILIKVICLCETYFANSLYIKLKLCDILFQFCLSCDTYIRITGMEKLGVTGNVIVKLVKVYAICYYQIID